MGAAQSYCASAPPPAEKEVAKQVEEMRDPYSACLGWRKVAALSQGRAAPPPPQPSVAPEKEMRVDLSLQSTRLSLEDAPGKVEEFLSSDRILKEPAFTPDGVGCLKAPHSDWRGFSEWLHNRVREVNALGGPRMLVVSWKTLKKLGRFPRLPDDAKHVLDAERLLQEYRRLQDEQGKVDGRVICFSFFSHRWERPGSESGAAHPDSAEHKKARALAKFGEYGSCPIFAPNHDFDYYFWIDYSCIHQDDAALKEAGVGKLCAFVAACIQIIMYNSGTADYEPRAWTRLERVMGYTYCACPLFKYLDDSYPCQELDIDKVVAQYPNAFTKGPDGGLMLTIRDPAGMDAMITNENDRPLLRRLSSCVQTAQPMNPARTWHGVDELKFEESLIPLDTKHYGMDVLKAKARLVRQL